MKKSYLGKIKALLPFVLDLVHFNFSIPGLRFSEAAGMYMGEDKSIILDVSRSKSAVDCLFQIIREKRANGTVWHYLSTNGKNFIWNREFSLKKSYLI